MSTTLRGVSGHAPTSTRPASADAGPAGAWGQARTWAGDLAALAPLVVAIIGLASRDGGRGLAATWPLAVTAAIALPAVVGELRRLPRVATSALAVWLVGLVLGVALAVHREHMVLPLLQYAIAPVLVLAARRIWPRSWAPAVLLLTLIVAFGRYQERSWSDWWVRTEGGEGLWRPLSWRNQSAALTGMFGAWFLGASLASTRLVRLGLALLAAAAMAGTWLSSSRAGLIVGIAAAVVAAVLGWRSAARRGEPAWRPAVVVAGVVATSALLVAGLLSMQPSGSAQPLAGRDQSVEQNTLARIEHTEAAVGMFLARPLTGQGLGSYRDLAREWNDPNGNLTGSAHNEYAEVAGETGVLGLAALLTVLAGAALLGLRLLREPPVARGPDDLRAPLVVGGVGAVALFVVHSAVDFDWNYPVLSALAAVALAMMLPSTSERVARRAVTIPVAGLLIVVLGAGLALGAVERGEDPAPWDASALVAEGEDALADGDAAEAARLADAALRWNPASAPAASLAARAQFAVDGDAEALVRAAMADTRWFSGRARAAMDLAHAGDVDRAHGLLSDLHADLDTFTAWGVTQTRLLTVEAEVATAAATSCEAATTVVSRALAADDDRPLPDVAPGILAERLVLEGCPPA